MGHDSFQTVWAVRRLQTRLLLILAGITLAVFAGVCGHEFVHFDDNVNIYANPHVQGLSWEHLKWMFTDTSYARRYMPLGWLSYAVDYQLFGLNPQAYHVGNLLLHLANVVLLYFLLKRLLVWAHRPAKPDEMSAAPVWCAAVGALFWAVNPLRVEAVAWASSRIYCVVFLFTICFLLAWLRAQDPATTGGRRALFYWMAVAAYAASLFTYPLALFAPVALFVLEVYPLRRVGVKISAWWQPATLPIWRDKLPFLALAAVALWTISWARVVTDWAHRPVTLEEFSLLSRLMQACYIWAYYAWKPWAPYDLSASYATLHSFNSLEIGFLASAAFVILASLALLILRRRWPAALALWLCHLAVLVPVLGLSEYPHSPYDRYSYLQGIVWSVGLALLLKALWERGKQGYLAGVVVTGASLLFALSAWQQVTVWSSTITLHQHILAHLGDNPCRARFDEVLGVHYLRCGLTNEAVASFQNVLYYESRRADRHIYQENLLPRAHVRLGDACAGQSHYDEALGHYRAALALDPGSINALIKLGSTLAFLHREAEAVEFFQEAIRLKPNNSQAHHNLALALRKLGREDQALEQFQAERRFSKNQ